MNQGRIWCVVNPSVGLPLLIGSVAVTSLVVHAAVLTHTPWMSAYWTGASKAKVSMNETASPAALAAATTDPSFSITVTPTKTADNGQNAFVVTVTPKASAAATGEQGQSTGKLALAVQPPG